MRERPDGAEKLLAVEDGYRESAEMEDAAARPQAAAHR